jgi:hypothetical protein
VKAKSPIAPEQNILRTHWPRFLVGVFLLLIAVGFAIWGFSKTVLSPDQRQILLWILPLASGFAASAFAGSLSVRAKGFVSGLVITATGGFGVWLLSFFFLFPTSQFEKPSNQVTMQAGLRSLLTPGNDEMPATPGLVIEPDRKAAFLGNIVTTFPIDLKSFSLIQMGGDNVLSVEWNSPLGIVINAELHNENDELVATIKKNVFHVYAPNDYTVTSDEHSILILNSKDEIILNVRYLNPRAIKAMGVFNHPRSPTVHVEEGRCFVGQQEISGQVYNKASGGGHWYDLKVVLVVP